MPNGPLDVRPFEDRGTQEYNMSGLLHGLFKCRLPGGFQEFREYVVLLKDLYCANSRQIRHTCSTTPALSWQKAL